MSSVEQGSAPEWRLMSRIIETAIVPYSPLSLPPFLSPSKSFSFDPFVVADEIVDGSSRFSI